MADRSNLPTIVARANPVPDPTTTAAGLDAHRMLLALIDERVAAADIPARPERPSPIARHHHRPVSPWLVAATAAVAVFVLVGSAVWLVGGSGNESADSSTAAAPSGVSSMTLPAPQQPTPVLFGGAMTDAWNRGDLRTYATFFADGSIYDGLPIDSASNTRIFEFLVAAGWRESAEDCTQYDPVSVTCTGIVTDDLHGPAGLAFPFTRLVRFDDSGLISSLHNDIDLTGMNEFDAAFDEWLVAAHPDIAAKEYLLNNTLSDPKAVVEAIGVVDEFLEQSSAYPIAE